MNATRRLHDLGQSLWLDNITRDMLNCGVLKGYIDELLAPARVAVTWTVGKSTGQRRHRKERKWHHTTRRIDVTDCLCIAAVQ